jgi:hypothetical protein
MNNLYRADPEIDSKVTPVQAVEALRVVRGWGSHIFQTFGTQMAASLSALRAGRFLPPERFLVLISVRGWVDPRAIVRLEGLGKLKKIHLIRGSNRQHSSLYDSE